MSDFYGQRSPLNIRLLLEPVLGLAPCFSFRVLTRPPLAEPSLSSLQALPIHPASPFRGATQRRIIPPPPSLLVGPDALSVAVSRPHRKSYAHQDLAPQPALFRAL